MTNSRKFVEISFLLLLILTASLFAQEQRLVAILPFDNEGSSAYDWVSRGIEEILYNKVSDLSPLQAFEKETLTRILKKLQVTHTAEISVKKAFAIGKETGADVIITGAYKVTGDRLKIHFRLISTYTGNDIFNDTYTDRLSAIFDMHVRALKQMLNTMALTISPEEEAKLERPLTNSIQAFESYCKAYVQFQKGASMEVVAGLFKKAIDIDPDFWEAQYNLGVIYYNFDRYDKAIQQFKKVVSRNSEFFKPYYGMGIIYFIKRQYRDAIRNLKKAIELNPDYDRSYYYLGRVYLRMDSIEQAIDFLNKAAKLNKNYAPIQYYIGKANMKRGWYKTAIAAFKKAIKLNPNYYLAHNALGEAFYRIQRYDEAMYEYRKAIEIKKSFSTAYFNLGNAIYKKNALEEIVEAYLDILESRYSGLPENSKERKMAEELKKLKGERSMAEQEVYRRMIQAYRNALKYEPGFFEAAFNLALTYENIGQLDSAEYFYKKALESNPRLVRAHMRLGRLYERQKRYHEALEQFKEVVKIEPSYFADTPKLGEPYRYINIIEAVLQEYRAKYQQNPNDPETLLVLARIYASIGRYGQAREFYSQVIKIQPSNREATLALKKLNRQLQKM